jgi:O-antigen ligase
VPTEQHPRRVATPASRSVLAPAADAVAASRMATGIIVAGAVGVVLAALPYPVFELDRYTFPKELVLLATALAAALVCLASARRLTVFMVDALLGGYLVVSAVSTLGAGNGWLAFRALGVSLAGAGLFWCARTVSRAGGSGVLLAGLAAAVVLGAFTGLGQAYGLVNTSLASLSRAPGGTFGNRNFMAHLVAIGFPLLLALTFEARTRTRFALGTAAIALAAAALVLSRSRAAWLGAGLPALFLIVEGFWIGRLWGDGRLRRRALGLATVGLAGVVLALVLPNRLNWRSDSPYLESLTGVANYREGSGRGRVIQYANTLRLAAGHPVLGVGPGNWPVYYPTVMSKDDPSFDSDDIIPTNPWPSSDWMAVVSERGFAALVLVGLVVGTLALGAWARVRRGAGHQPALTDLAIVATLLAVAVVGAFDAVLLLPAPTLFAWSIVGALASSARPIRELPLTSRSRRAGLIAVALVGGVFLARCVAHTAALAAFSGGSRAAM